MTLCIAAACKEDKASRIVLCTDQMVSSEAWSSETEFKLVQLPRFVGMFSGVISEARETLSIYEKHLKEKEQDKALSGLSAHEWLEQLRAPLRIRRRTQIEHLIASRTGLTIREFMEKFDKLQHLHAKIQEEVETKSYDIELLLAGFTEGSPALSSHLMCRVQKGDIEIHTHFTCIGTGAEAAEQSLHRRKQNEQSELGETIYHVFEAKKMGEQSPLVGQETMMAVLSPRTDRQGAPGYDFRLLRWETISFFEIATTTNSVRNRLPVSSCRPKWSYILSTNHSGFNPRPSSRPITGGETSAAGSHLTISALARATA